MAETTSIVDIRATVTKNSRYSQDTSIITLDCPAIAAAAKPGNFVNVKVSDATQPLLRRPFSIHNVRGNLIDIMVQAVGAGTSLLCNSPEGSSVMVLGPLGNCFDITSREFDTAILVSGGIGTAPMLFLEKTLAAKGKKVINLIGGRTKEYLLAKNLSNCRFATDDGSSGFRGNVVELLQNELPGFSTEGTLKLFACGPTPMLKSLAGFCRQHHLSGDLSLESVMGCGIGICYGCSVEVNAPDGTVRTILLCREGPVIDAELLAGL
ncbi:MAG: dihydroorotate dehydrogenase electron transfer subunit [Chlorobium sp.]|nr:MAG: dihydroorotate dehydrogenase electron transfer subunit [Chlorobium sp.]